MTEENSNQNITDLNNIAISFSGGGYRASAFHLGSLDLLDKVGLRENITMLSTVSGGSITGGKYACALSEAVSNNNPDFYEGFYREIYTFMLETRLPNLWFNKLHPEDTDKPSLIAAAVGLAAASMRFAKMAAFVRQDSSEVAPPACPFAPWA